MRSIAAHFYPPHVYDIQRLAARMGVSEEEAVARLAEVSLWVLRLSRGADPDPVLKAMFPDESEYTKAHNLLGETEVEFMNDFQDPEDFERAAWGEARKSDRGLRLVTKARAIGGGAK